MHPSKFLQFLEMRKKEQSPWKQLLLVVAAPLFHLPLPPGNFLLVIKEPFLFWRQCPWSA